MSALGSVTLDLTMVVIAVAIFASVVGRRFGSASLLTLSRRSVYLVAALLTLAVLTLLALIFSNDFTVKMVQSSSSRELTWPFKLALLWVDLESSLLFWAWMLSLFSALAVWRADRTVPDLVPAASAILMLMLAFFVYLLQFHKNPFDEYLVERPVIGAGLRPLLRNPWMLIHPPAQYLGYISTAVPFAFCLAALLRATPAGRLNDDWLRAMRPWILAAWLLLGLGLVLGMIWAYELIDWGGWWGWDPIENAALIPWLTATVMVHATMSRLKRGTFRGWTLAMILVTFWLTIFGTFMTRAGFVRSVHAFGKDMGLFWAFVVFMGIGIPASLALVFSRIGDRLSGVRSLAPNQDGEAGTRPRWLWVLNLEVFFWIVNILLVFCALFVLTATLYPTFSELFGRRQELGPEFFETWMAPLGLLLLALIGLAPLLSWRGVTLRSLADQLFWPFLLMVAVMLCLPLLWPRTFPFMREVTLGPWVISAPGISKIQLAIGLSALVVSTVVQTLLRIVRARAKARDERWPQALWRTLAQNPSRWAAHAVHLGMALMFLGFAGRAVEVKKDQVLDPGDHVRIGGWELQHQGLVFRRGAKADAVQSVLLVRKPGTSLAEALAPGTRIFHENPRMPVSDVAIWRGLGEDLHIRLAGYQGQRVTLNLAVHPLVSWLWLGFLVMLLGGLIGMIGQPAARPSRNDGMPPVATGSWRLIRRGLLALAGVSVLVVITLLITGIEPRDVQAGVALGLVWFGVIGAVTCALWSFRALSGAGPSPHSLPANATRSAVIAAQIQQDLQALEEEVDTGKLPEAEAEPLRAALREDLAEARALADAEAERPAIRAWVQSALSALQANATSPPSNQCEPATTGSAVSLPSVSEAPEPESKENERPDRDQPGAGEPGPDKPEAP